MTSTTDEGIGVSIHVFEEERLLSEETTVHLGGSFSEKVQHVKSSESNEESGLSEFWESEHPHWLL